MYVNGNWYGWITKATISDLGKDYQEGRPGGKVSPRERNAAENTPKVDIERNPIYPSHIAVTDTATLTRYANGLVWLDEKTEYYLTINCYDSHIIDFHETVIIDGVTWYLDSNSIDVDGDTAAVVQTCKLVRWA